MATTNVGCHLRTAAFLAMVITFVSACVGKGQSDAQKIAIAISQMGVQQQASPTAIHSGQKLGGVNHGVALSQYAETIALQLSDQFVPNAGVVVTSFVDLDNTLKTTHPLGNQLSEALKHALSSKGYSVAEINAGNGVEVTPNGNFALTRDARRSANSEYVVAGTLTYSANGVTVYTRLFSAQTNNIAASSVVTLPYFLVEDL